jgi:AraC-like DNA-binding protein/mannose-6-phosphate isomerase-like protein (cupin superfamily)
MSRHTEITTYSPDRFLQAYIRSEKELDDMLKPDFSKFFMVKVQDLLRLIRLPVPPVRTTNHTFIFITHGQATMVIGSERYKIHKNECLFVPAGQVYSFARRDKNRGYLCNFHDDFIIGKLGTTELLKDFEFLKVWGNPCIKFDIQTSKFVLHLFKRLLQAYSTSGLKSINLLQSYFIALLCEVNNVYKPLSFSPQTNSVNINNRFRELLFANFRSKQLVTDYASLLNITPNHLNKVVKLISGKSPTKWIDEAIVLEAKVLLYQSNSTVRDIAAEVGIFDQSYFSRLFKKYEGVTPLQFRRMIEKSKK